jgi:hypothetical protein
VGRHGQQCGHFVMVRGGCGRRRRPVVAFYPGPSYWAGLRQMDEPAGSDPTLLRVPLGRSSPRHATLACYRAHRPIPSTTSDPRWRRTIWRLRAADVKRRSPASRPREADQPPAPTFV